MEVHGCGFGTGWTSLPSLYFPVAMSSLLAGEGGGEGSPSLSLSSTSHETAVSTPAESAAKGGRRRPKARHHRPSYSTVYPPPFPSSVGQYSTATQNASLLPFY